MQRFYYYAELNDNDVCVRIVSSVNKMSGSRYIPIPEYNETFRYRKWLGDQWSQETYEPDVDTVIQDRLKVLETENQQLKNEVTQLNDTINILNGSIIELTQLIANLTGGAE